MPMNRDFTWNKSREKIDYDNAMAAAAAAGAMNGGQDAWAADPSKYYSMDIIRGIPFNNMGQAYSQAMQQSMAQDAEIGAKIQRLKELETQMQERDRNIQKMMDDPKMQLAVAMAMYGDNGMLQSMLTNVKEESSNQNQTDMDSLEEKMANDIFALGSASDDQFDKIVRALIPLYKNRFVDLEGKGAISRLGGWDAWEQAILGAKGSFNAKKANEDYLKAKKKAQEEADKAAVKKLKR